MSILYIALGFPEQPVCPACGSNYVHQYYNTKGMSNFIITCNKCDNKDTSLELTPELCETWNIKYIIIDE